MVQNTVVSIFRVTSNGHTVEEITRYVTADSLVAAYDAAGSYTGQSANVDRTVAPGVRVQVSLHVHPLLVIARGCVHVRQLAAEPVLGGARERNHGAWG